MFVDLAPPSPAAIAPTGARLTEAGRYGARPTVNVSAIAAVLLLHAIAIGALLQMRSEHGKVTRHALTVVDLTPAPAPPPSAAQPPPAQLPPQAAAPLPMLDIVRTEPVQIAIVAPLPEPAPVAVTPLAAPAPAAQPSVVQASELGTRTLSAPPPRYPAESRRKHEEGTVVLSLVLSGDGRVASISVAQSSGHPRLDEAALRAVRKWRWAPTLRDGTPVMVRGVVEIPFVLQG